MLKDFQVELELSPKDNRVIQTGATYWSHDVNTAKINIKLLRHSEPVVLNKDVTVRVMMLFDDENKSEHIYTAKIENEKAGIVSVILDKNVRSYVGQVICGVYADYGAEQKTDNGYFTFAMKRSLIDKRMPEMKQYYVSDFEDTLAKMKLTNAEFATVEKKLNDRVTVLQQTIENINIKTAIENLSPNSAGNLLSLKSFGNSKLTQIKLEEEDWIRVEKQDGTVVTGVLAVETNDQIYLEENETYFFALDHQSYFGPTEINYVFIKDHENGNPQQIQMSGKDVYSEYSTSYGFFKAKKSGFHTLIIGTDKRETTSSSRGFYLRRWRTYRTNVKVTSWVPSEKELATKNDLTVLQKQIDDLKTKTKEIDNIKKAITTLGGTL